MWNISVAPMPSMISMPVASPERARRVGQLLAGGDALRSASVSDAELLLARAGGHRPVRVGAVKQTVTPCSSIAVGSSTGVAFSSSTVEAPACSGNTGRRRARR